MGRTPLYNPHNPFNYQPRLTPRQRLFDSAEPEEIVTSADMIEESLTPLVTDTGPLPSPDSAGGRGTTPETSLEKYKQLLKGYAGKQDMLTTGVGGASQALQAQSDKERSASGGLGTLHPETFLQQLTRAATAAAGAIGEQRGTRKEQELATAKELARLDAAGAEAAEDKRRWEIEHGTPDPININADYYATQAPRYINDLDLKEDSAELANFNATATRNFNRFNELFPKDNHAEIIEKTLIYSSMAGDGDGGYDRDVADKLSQALEISLLAKQQGRDPMKVDGSYEFFAEAYKTKGGDWKNWRAFVLEDTD